MAAKTVDECLAGFPDSVQSKLRRVRDIVRENAPGADEAIVYGIPTYKLQGNLVHFAGYRNHIGFYPTPSGIAAFKRELAGFASSKGAVRFPISEPLPEKPIADIVKYRVKQAT
ncbi:MAG: hypothetical protein GF331_14410 [Chitinivibrionales bacterium]|nr:hypothetical protein [Chitinivibrionales bacterium]